MFTTRTTIKIATYSCEVVFIVTDDLISQVNKVYHKHNIPGKWNEKCEGVVVTADIDRYYLIIDSKYITHNTISHEIFHLTVRVTADRGIEEEEARAWLSGHFSENLYKFLNKKKLQIKHG